MNDDPILRGIADRNPVTQPPNYDDSAERGLHDLMVKFRNERPRTRAGSASLRLRRSLPIWGSITVGAGVAVAVAALVATQGGVTPAPVKHVAARPATVATSPSPQVPVADASTPASLVVERTASALNNANDYLLESDQTTHNVNGQWFHDLSWRDEADHFNGYSKDWGNGVLQLETFNYHDGGVVNGAVIDYTHREYALDTKQPITKPGTYLYNDAGIITKDLKSGEDRITGSSKENGRTILALSNAEEGMNRQIWVDAATYLPVRMTAHGTWGSYEIDYSWVKRTPENLKSTFAARIPQGFTKVDKITGD